MYPLSFASALGRLLLVTTENMKNGFTKGLVSVIIPCYNGESWIAETLKSVVRQTLPASRIEVIIVDDGSTDDSVKVVQQCMNSTFKLLCTRNNGVSHARNLGTMESRGEFIKYLDADDLLRPEALSMQIAALESSGADVAYSNWQRLIQDGKGNFVAGQIVRRRIEDVNPDVELAVYSSFWAPPVSLLYRRAIVERVGGWNQLLPVIQDARFLQDAAHFGAKFTYLDEVLGDYRTHRHGSLSTRSRFQFEKDILLNNQEIEDRWERSKRMTPPRRACLRESYRRSSAFFFWHDADLFRLAHRRSLLVGGSMKCGMLDLLVALSKTIGPVGARRVLYPLKFLSDFGRVVLRRNRALLVRALRRRAARDSKDKWRQS